MTTSPGSGTGVGEMSSPPRAHLLKRVLSQSSSGTPGPTPEAAGRTSSPSSGSVGYRTPRARKAVLRSSPIPTSTTPATRKGSGEGLASDLQQHSNVRSPQSINPSLPPSASNTSPWLSDQIPHRPPAPPSSNSSSSEAANGTTTRNHSSRSFSHSTEGSSSTSEGGRRGHPVPPASLGATYTSEGFSNQNQYTPDQAAIIARTDDMVKQMNGTSSVYGPSTTNPSPWGASPWSNQESGYVLPRDLATFIKPQQREMRPPAAPIDHGSISRQSSTSSTTTEASTSSEESDLCIPTIEWVSRPSPSASGLTPSQSTPSYQYNKYVPGSVSVNSRSPRRRPSPRVIPSPRRPSGGLGSALPPGASAGDSTDEDDEATVGHARGDRSSTSSSQSNQSGFQMLLQAAENAPPLIVPGESKGKRKAGNAAVVQWRSSGIPTGPSGAEESRAEPPKKRRRSELKLEEPEKEILPDVDGSSDEEALDDKSESSESAEVLSEEEDSEYGAGGGAGAGTGKSRRPSTRGRKKAGNGATRTVSGSGNKPAIAKSKKNTSMSPPKIRRGSVTAPGQGGVQCPYVNPLPPYNRCQDFFTRRYDLPRHIGRHARREGELVKEGLLAPEKALEWNKVKDKPKVTCETCGETFTRNDALKRHKAKQHH